MDTPDRPVSPEAARIRVSPDPVLRTPAKNVTAYRMPLERLIGQMRETMEALSGIGIAAPQIGVSLTVAVIDIADVQVAIANPQLTVSGDVIESREGCLSLPGETHMVPRWTRVHLTGVDALTTEPVDLHLEGLPAIVAQHEVDHLHGILIDARRTPLART